MRQYDERSEAQIAADLRANFPGHPVPAHPLTGRADCYHQEQDRIADDMVRRVERSEHARRHPAPPEPRRISRPPRRRPRPLLAFLLVALAVAIAAIILGGCGAAPAPKLDGSIGQVYRLESGATRVNLTVYNIDAVEAELGLDQIILVDDAGMTWRGPAETRGTIAPGDYLPVEIDGALPPERRVVTVVIMAPGRAPVELQVEAHHRRGVWR